MSEQKNRGHRGKGELYIGAGTPPGPLNPPISANPTTPSSRSMERP